MAQVANDKPLVSVVLIFFNSERFIAEAIDSVLAQTHRPLEVILVDDGSQDASTAIAKDFVARHPDIVRYVTHAGGINRGMAASRNRGAAVARGDYLAFIDSDDIWLPCKISEQFAILEENPTAALVCGAILYWHSWDETATQADSAVLTAGIADQLVAPPRAALKAYPLGKSSGAGVDFLVRRSVFQTLGGFEAIFRQMFEDQSFLLKVFLELPVFLSSKVWLKYRQHPESCCSVTENDGSYAIERARFFDWLERYIAGRAIDPRVAPALQRARLRKPPGLLASFTRRLFKAVVRRVLPPDGRPLGDLHA